MDQAIAINLQDQEAEAEQPRERTRWDRAWYVITSAVAIIARLAQWALGIWLGLFIVPLIRSSWTGTPAGTLAICLVLIGLFAITEFIVWGWREALEWLLAWLEVATERKEKQADGAPQTSAGE